MTAGGRSPQGERGLKSTLPTGILVNAESLPARGAWIEIPRRRENPPLVVSLPARGAWIEIAGRGRYLLVPQSLPARGAWIEIAGLCYRYYPSGVAPRKGSVD